LEEPERSLTLDGKYLRGNEAFILAAFGLLGDLELSPEDRRLVKALE
jgi:hypothetical protein